MSSEYRSHTLHWHSLRGKTCFSYANWASSQGELRNATMAQGCWMKLEYLSRRYVKLLPLLWMYHVDGYAVNIGNTFIYYSKRGKYVNLPSSYEFYRTKGNQWLPALVTSLVAITTYPQEIKWEDWLWLRVWESSGNNCREGTVAEWWSYRLISCCISLIWFSAFPLFIWNEPPGHTVVPPMFRVTFLTSLDL